MKYFVIGTDGAKYGPADTSTLKAWRQEGRLNDDTWLEEEGSTNRYQAREVLGPSQTSTQSQARSAPPPVSPEPQVSRYSRQEHYAAAPQDDGMVMVIFGWILAVLSLCCCPPVTGGGAIVLGVLAKKKGNPGAQALIITAVIILVVWLVLILFFKLSIYGLQELIIELSKTT